MNRADAWAVASFLPWGAAVMPGRSKITADEEGHAALRALARSAQRSEADRARAILLTLAGQRAAEIAASLV